MHKYLQADLRRISTRIPRWILLALTWIGSVIMTISGNDTLLDASDSIMSWLIAFTVIFGVLELIFVYNDDFKAKTMQIAIGSGVPRRKIIFAKGLEYTIALAFDFIMMTVLDLIAACIFVGTTGGVAWNHLLIEVFMAWFGATAIMGSLLFIMYLTQGISITLILYILVSSGIAASAVKLLASLVKLTKYHLQTYFITSCLNAVKTRLLLGHVSWSNLLLILFYLLFGFILAVICFRKKELEF